MNYNIIHKSKQERKRIERFKESKEIILVISFEANKMKCSFLLICCFLLLISYLQVVTCCDQGQYLHNGSCCLLCPAGTRVLKHCTSDAASTCIPCSTGTFSDHLNKLSTCQHCKDCGLVKGLHTLKHCLPEQDSLCDCKAGFFCIIQNPKSCLKCRNHTPCPTGEGVKKAGTTTTDTVCEVCVDGTYSNKNSPTQVCKELTDCDDLGMLQTVPGSTFYDTTCAYPETIVVPVVVIVVIAVTGTILWRRQYRRNSHARSEQSGHAWRSQIHLHQKPQEGKDKDSQRDKVQDQNSPLQPGPSGYHKYTIEEKEMIVKPVQGSNGNAVKAKMGDSQRGVAVQIITKQPGLDYS
ncbi:tumor necrosis factor receptor superfamily member 5-like isoform X2 [Heptranchias perlo]|uniref:tumor necrosis factor receptor superfamily member 5-like isoform X2 n=1 Tax=Heptranchias perlo TaxID=212740 RepID=UPI003559E82E